MATVYHRDQAGAPALTYSTSANAVAHFDNLKTVLKACLVNGYGDQPAAGWELISEGTNYIVLRNGSHTGYLGLSFSSGVVTIHISETYTGVVSNILQGDGLRTGVAANNSVPHRFGISHFAYAADNSTWMVVADDKTFLLNAITNNVAGIWVPDLAGAGSLNFLLYAGEDSNGNFIAMGGRNLASGAITNSFSSIGFTSLRDPSTGLLVDVGSLSVQTHGLTETQRIAVAVLTPPSVDMVKTYWHGAGVFGGHFRGVVMPGVLSPYSPSQVAQCLGFSGYNSRTAHNPLGLGAGANYLVPVYHPQSVLVLITDDPEFW